MSNSLIWPQDQTLSGATTPTQSGPESQSNEGVLHVPQISSITGVSPPDGVMSYPGHSPSEWGNLTPHSREVRLVYATDPANWAVSLQVRVDLGVMVMKRYSILPKSPKFKPHHQKQFNVTLKINRKKFSQ